MLTRDDELIKALSTFTDLVEENALLSVLISYS